MELEMRPTPLSKELCSNIIAAMVGKGPAYASSDQLVAITRNLNGNELCDALGLPQTTLHSQLLVKIKYGLFWLIAIVFRISPRYAARKSLVCSYLSPFVLKCTG